MTKLAILADIHGNWPALVAVLDDLAQFAVDRVVVAGDLINWGPHSVAVVERALAERWSIIRGNNEFYLLDYETPRAPAAWADRDHFPLLPWLTEQFTPQLRQEIAAWPDTLSLHFPDAPPLRIVHGSPRNNDEGLVPAVTPGLLAEQLAGVPETTIVAAHTHLPVDARIGHWHLLNPGSVGVPLQGQHLASYLLLEGSLTGWTGTHRQVPFSNEGVYRTFAQSGFLERCGVIGALVLAEFQQARIQVVPFLRWRAATCPTAPFNQETLTRYHLVDPTPYLPAPYLPPSAAVPLP